MTTDTAQVKAALRQQQIETPSWAYGNSGTRFKVFAQRGVPRTPQEKIDDAAQVHRFTGVAPSVALHIPWDRVDDYAALAAYAGDRGVRLGATPVYLWTTAASAIFSSGDRGTPGWLNTLNRVPEFPNAQEGVSMRWAASARLTAARSGMWITSLRVGGTPRSAG